MTLVPQSRPKPDEQEIALQSHINGKKEYLKFEYHNDDFQAQFIFYLGGVTIPGIQEKFFSQSSAT